MEWSKVIPPYLRLARGLGRGPEACYATRRICIIRAAEGTTFPDM